MSIFTLYLGGFGLTLMTNPAMYFAGDKGILPYWTTEMDEAAETQNRLFGTQVRSCCALLYPCWYSPSSRADVLSFSLPHPLHHAAPRHCAYGAPAR